MVKAIKSRTSRLLREEFPALKSKLPTLWTNSYSVATVGGAPLDVVKRHVENQKNRWSPVPTGREYRLDFTSELAGIPRLQSWGALQKPG